MRLLVAALSFAICVAPAAAFAQSASPPPSATDGAFTFTLPQSRVVVKVPDPSLRPSAPAGGAANYFKLERRDPLLIVSGWLEPAARYKGLAAFWQSESRSPAFAGPLAPTRVEMLHEGSWEIVAFDVALPGGGTQANLRAERVEAGTWIDLHLSTVSMRPAATLRAELLAVLRKVQVSEKAVPRSP
jgi:hypothetical protein